MEEGTSTSPIAASHSAKLLREIIQDDESREPTDAESCSLVFQFLHQAADMMCVCVSLPTRFQQKTQVLDSKANPPPPSSPPTPPRSPMESNTPVDTGQPIDLFGTRTTVCCKPVQGPT